MLSGVVLWVAFAAGCGNELRTPAGGGWVSVSVGDGTACAAHADGHTECFGRNQRDWVTVAARDWVEVAHDHAVCGIDHLGHAACHDTAGSRHARPMGEDVVQVVTYGGSPGFSCIVRVDGAVACSGIDLDTDDLSGSTSLAVSMTDLCGLADGRARCLSLLDPPTESTEGRNVFLAGPWSEFDAGRSVLCGVTPEGEVRCDADLALPGTLHALAMNPDQVGVACALDDDDRPVCTGSHGDEEVPDVALRTLSVGAYHACGITQGDGSLVCWNWAVPPYR